jgi:hypothetical protein
VSIRRADWSIQLRSGLIFFNMEYMRRRDYLSQLELMVLLAILRTRQNAYGMSIVREIEQHSGREVALAGIYAALERPERVNDFETPEVKNLANSRQAAMRLWPPSAG